MTITVDNGDLTDFEVDVGAGAVDVNTQRVTLASNDPAVAHLAAIETAVEGTLAVSGPLTDAELRASAVPVSGTFFQATQPVSGTVAVTGVATAAKQDSQITLLAGGLPAALAANGGLKVEGVAGGVAVPVSVATIPSHAVTNAGTFAVQVDGNALTALQLIDDVVVTFGTSTYTETTSKGNLISAIRRDADTTLVDTTNEAAPLQVDARGCLKVEAFSGETLPVSLASVPSHAVTNAGTFAVQVDGNALTALQLIDDTVIADDAGFTAGATKVSMAGFVADEGSTDSVNEDDAGAARMTLDRKIIVANYVHAAAGGATPHKNLDCDETEDDIKTSAGKLYWLHAVNLSNGKRYLKFYNATAANVSVGTTTPVLTFTIPTFADTNGAGFTINFGDVGIQFDTAICVAATTGFADNDTGAPGANEVIINVGYA